MQRVPEPAAASTTTSSRPRLARLTETENRAANISGTQARPETTNLRMEVLPEVRICSMRPGDISRFNFPVRKISNRHLSFFLIRQLSSQFYLFFKLITHRSIFLRLYSFSISFICVLFHLSYYLKLVV